MSIQPLHPVPHVGGFAPLRTPPHNFEAEMALLGSLLANNRSYERICDIVKAEHFADDRHGRIFKVCVQLIERGSEANPVTLKNYFEQDASLNDIGGTQYLSRLATAVVSTINGPDYARVVRDMWRRRQIINAAQEMMDQAHAFDDPEQNAASIVEQGETALFDLVETGGAVSEVSIGDAVGEAIAFAERAHKADGKLIGVPSGLTDLDRKTGGFYPGDLVILAGRTSMGKTALAVSILKKAAQAGKAGAFFSLEMSRDQLGGRMLSSETAITADQLRTGNFRTEQFAELLAAKARLEKLGIQIVDAAYLTLGALRTRARRLVRRKKADFIIVDYLQLLSMGGKTENRLQEVSAISRGLKALAKELNVPVIALAQLSRAVEQRADKRPQLSDLRESGTIEQDADVVMFIFREAYYLENSPPVRGENDTNETYAARVAEHQARLDECRNKAEVILEKNRHGKRGLIEVFFDPEKTTFSNLANDQGEPRRYGDDA